MVAPRVLSGLNGAAKMASVWLPRVWRSSPVAASHSRADLSSLAVLSQAPFGLNATELTAPVWPASVRAPAVPVIVM
jgi:hypothetical protein